MTPLSTRTCRGRLDARALSRLQVARGPPIWNVRASVAIGGSKAVSEVVTTPTGVRSGAHLHSNATRPGAEMNLSRRRSNCDQGGSDRCHQE